MVLFLLLTLLFIDPVHAECIKDCTKVLVSNVRTKKVEVIRPKEEIPSKDIEVYTEVCIDGVCSSGEETGFYSKVTSKDL